jgi:multiple sugar transport system substrate-binding protein
MAMQTSITGFVAVSALALASALVAAAPRAHAQDACTEVRVMATAGPEAEFAAKTAKEDFEKATGIKVVFDTVSRDIQAQRATSEFVSSSGQYDVVFVGNQDKLWIGRAHSVDMNKFLPASDVAKLIPQIRALATTDDGKLVAIPQYWNTTMYFYRKDLFLDPQNKTQFRAKYGYDLAPPATWEQVVDIAEFFNRPPQLYGTFISGVSWASIFDYYKILFGVGGEPSDLKSNTMRLDSPQSVKTLSIIQRLAKMSPPGFRTQSFFDADKLMLGGKLAAYTDFSYIWATLSKTPDKYAMAPMPGPGSALAAGFWWAVPEKAPHLDCARKLLSWMLSDGYQTRQMLAMGNPPSTSSVMNDKDATSKIASFDAYVTTAGRLKIVNVSWAHEMGDGIASAMADVISDKKTPEEAAKWLQTVKFQGRKPLE